MYKNFAGPETKESLQEYVEGSEHIECRSNFNKALVDISYILRWRRYPGIFIAWLIILKILNYIN